MTKSNSSKPWRAARAAVSTAFSRVERLLGSMMTTERGTFHETSAMRIASAPVWLSGLPQAASPQTEPAVATMTGAFPA